MLFAGTRSTFRRLSSLINAEVVMRRGFNAIEIAIILVILTVLAALATIAGGEEVPAEW
jgi:hypothetical protein